MLQRAWIRRQFSQDREKAGKGYRQFGREGIGQGTIYGEVRGQTVLGKEDFVEGLIDHLRKRKDIFEIPKSQRFLHRPELDKLFTGGVIGDRRKRDERVGQAVEL